MANERSEANDNNGDSSARRAPRFLGGKEKKEKKTRRKKGCLFVLSINLDLPPGGSIPSRNWKYNTTASGGARVRAGLVEKNEMDGEKGACVLFSLTVTPPLLYATPATNKHPKATPSPATETKEEEEGGKKRGGGISSATSKRGRKRERGSRSVWEREGAKGRCCARPATTAVVGSRDARRFKTARPRREERGRRKRKKKKCHYSPYATTLV